MNRFYLLAFLFVSSFFSVFAQNDGLQIDYTVSPPARNNSAALEVNSPNQGILVPRLATSQRTSIPAPANGLLVYDVDLSKFYYYDAVLPGWVAVGTGTGNGTLTAATASNGLTSSGGTTPDITLGGTLTGNTTITQGGNNMIFNLNGAGDFDVRDNGTSAFFIRDDGSVGINNTSPNSSAILDIVSTSKGILIPRMNYAQEQAITSPANGLMVFNTTSNCLDMFTGGAWQSIYCSCPVLQPLNAINGATTVCSGTTQTYSVPAIMGASSYTWTVTGNPAITGNGSTTISFAAPALNTYTVSVTASNACNTSVVNQSLVVNAYTAVPPTPAWTTTPTNICAGVNYNYNVVNGLGINGTNSVSYTWTITATGAATATLTANSQTASAGNPVSYTAAASGITLTHGSGLGTVTVSVAGNNTCGTTVTPLSVTQNIVAQPAVGTSPTSSQSVCTGATITLTSGAVSGTGSYTYQWYFNTTNSVSGASAIAGATGTIASGSATTNYVLNTANVSGASPAGTGFAGTYYYYCNFTPLNNTGCGPVTSGFAQVVVVAQPSVTTQPTASQTVCTGGGVTLSSAVSGTGSYTYQWFYNTSNLNTGGTSIAGATGTVASGNTINYTLVNNNGSTTSPAGTGVAGTYYYYCRFTPLNNTNCGPVSSNAATVIVVAQPTFTTQPTSTQTVCTGASVTLSGVVSGTGNYTFQWYYNTSNSNSGGSAISGATGTVAANSASNYPLVTTNSTTAAPAGTGVGGTFYYYCIFTPQGTTNCGPVTSSVAAVIVNIRSADPTSAVVSTATICAGQSTTLTLNGGGGGTSEVIKWYAGSCGGGLAGTGNNLSVSPTVTTTYYGRFEDPAPCSYNSACQSVTVTVNQPSVAPVSLTATPAQICTGSSTTLTQSGGSLGTGAVWKWYSNSGYTTLVGTGTGATASLTVSPTTTTTYWLRIENTTSPCTATINGPAGGVTVTVDQASVLGTVSNAGPINFCDAGGYWNTVPISVSGNTGTITWNYGMSNGGWSGPWVTGSQPGYNTFPKKVAVSDGNADRVRWSVTNGVCPATAFSPAILIQNRYNEAPTSLASNQNNYCINSVANITLTATFPTATNIFGNVEFYSGSCGGMLVATVAGNGTTTVAATITAPTATTSYFVRYNPGTGSGCAPTTCVSTTVNVTQIPANPGYGSSAWNVVAYNGGTIDLTGTYYGYYTEPLLSYTSLNRWCSGCSPSDASGWQGCVVPADNHVVVSRRTNFTCGYYRFDIPDHDDIIRIYVNGSLVFEHVTCCDVHTNVWSGYLTPSSSVEVRHYEGGGGSDQSLTIVPIGTSTSIAPSSITGTTTICQGSSTTLTQSGGVLANGANYVWYSGSCGGTYVGTGNSVTVSPGSTTTYYVRAEGTCNNTTCASVTVTVDAPSVLGTITNAGPIDFCDATGNWSAVPISVSGAVGTVTWQFGWSSGGWSGNWVNGTSPGYCCFPAKVSASDGNADRIRWFAQNGTCPATGVSSAILLRNHYTPAPSTLSSNQNNYCSGSIANITLTATFSAATSILGNVEFYSGSCGGTLVATVAGNGSTSVAATISAPTTTTNYYVRYNPGSGSGCSPTGCAGTTVTTNPYFIDPGFGSNIWNVVGYNGGNINLSGTCYGYYTESALSYNTLNRWGTGGSPSDASGWQGCYVPVDNHVVVSKRTGFPSGNYQLDMPNHDDDVRVYINGSLVWSHEPGCCDAHTNIWTGTLNSSSSIEVRHLEGGGGSHQSLTLTLVPTTLTFGYTGGVQSWTVPSGVTSVLIEAWGAQGGGYVYSGGYGGYASGYLSVSGGSVLSIYVGGSPGGTGGGWNGGGNSGGNGRGGGGASDVRNSGGTRVIVAAGGGGGGCDAGGFTGSAGAAGGGTTGSSSAASSGGYGSGDGATQSGGGGSTGCCGTGTAGGWVQGGDGASSGCGGYYAGYGGGGGGGYYGGGGGGNCGGNLGGGGGSSYTGGVSSGTTTGGVRSGNGQIKLTW